MKTYLTSKEFADLFFHLHDQNIRISRDASVTDRIIHTMFMQYEKEVKETLEGAMYGIEEFEGDKAIELVGYQFHKSFRQTDVIPAKHIDGIVWGCIQDSPMFWKTMEKACKILQSEDAAELYKNEVW